MLNRTDPTYGDFELWTPQADGIGSCMLGQEVGIFDFMCELISHNMTGDLPSPSKRGQLHGARPGGIRRQDDYKILCMHDHRFRMVSYYL